MIHIEKDKDELFCIEYQLFTFDCHDLDQCTTVKMIIINKTTSVLSKDYLAR